MKSGIILFFALLSYCSYGQWLPSEFDLDTMRYSFRTGGRLDSLDFSIARTSGTQPGGSLEFPDNIPTIDFFTQFRGGNRQLLDIQRKPLIFSAIPHIGFAYTFGTQGTQVARMNYQQIFAKKVIVNFDFTNDRGNGFLRNSNFRLNDVHLSLAKKGKMWSSHFNATDRVFNSALNGGIQAESDPDLFPLVFLAVQKSNASSQMRNTDLDLVNYFDLNTDSIKAFGLTTRHKLMIQGRSYNEEDTLFGIYNMNNFDTLSTSDAYQLSKTEHGVGGFYRSSKLFASARLDATYWKYYNRGKDRDTIETTAYFSLKYKTGNWSLNTNSNYNLSGAGNEWSTQFDLSGKIKDLRVSSFLSAEDRWPNQFQRFYFANNYDYDLGPAIQKQFKLNFVNKVHLELSSIQVELQHQSTYLKDQYYFSLTQGTWSNELLPAISLHRFGIRADWKYKILAVQPEYSYTFESGLTDLIPDYLLKFRTTIKGPIFKSKKMIAYLGSEMVWFSASNTISFVPSLDTYIFSGNTASTGMFNLHAFGGFQIDEFRFFVRFENIGYLWTSSSLELLENYPIPSSQLRVGLTWDFFN
jgi:hypothetical protein